MPAWDQIQQALYFHCWACLWASICLNKWYWYVDGFQTAVVKEFPLNSLTSLCLFANVSTISIPFPTVTKYSSFRLIMSVLRVSEIMFFCCLSSLLLQVYVMKRTPSYPRLHVVTVLYVSASLEENSSISNHISPLKSITLGPLCSHCGGIRSTSLGCLYWWSAPGLWKLSAAPFSRYTALKAFFFARPRLSENSEPKHTVQKLEFWVWQRLFITIDLYYVRISLTFWEICFPAENWMGFIPLC